MGIGTPVSLLIGMILILGSVGLFFLDKIKPTYARDSDKVYAVLILISGLFALTHWDMGPGQSFQLLLLSGMLTTLFIENVRLRVPKEVLPPVDNRPPRPRYDERPPVRRGYRAELDREPYRNRPPADLPPRRVPRVPPAQEAAWTNGYGDSRPQRQPYEEYREPVGRLQPSRQPGPAAPPDNRYSDNSRYGQRPPTPRPTTPSEGGPERPLDRGPEQSRDRRPERAPDRRPLSNSDAPLDPTEQTSRPPSSAEQPNRQASARERSTNAERALNVRPYSEAPKLDDDYRRPSKPEPSEY
ncbi:MAG: Ycf66 family protein [Cyanobacteria bacterium J06614_10]